MQTPQAPARWSRRFRRKPGTRKRSRRSRLIRRRADAGEEVFVKKKSKANGLGSEAALSFAKASQREKEPAMSSYYNSGISYSADDLKELSKNARNFGGSGGKDGAAGGGAEATQEAGEMKVKKRRTDDPEAPVVRMKGLPLAAPVKREQAHVAGDEDAGAAAAAAAALVRGPQGGANKEAAASIKEGLLARGGVKDGEFTAPSEAEITRLKARREQARKMGGGSGGSLAKEFIPLEGGVEEQVCVCACACARVLFAPSCLHARITRLTYT